MKDKKRAIEEDMLPFGFIIDGTEPDVTIDSQGNVWHDANDWNVEELTKLQELKQLLGYDD